MGVKKWLFVFVGLILAVGVVSAIVWAVGTTGPIAEIAEEEQSASLQLDKKPTESEHIHDFVKSVWETPTCQRGGYYNNICSSCGIVESVTQEPVPHDVEDILVQEGNCMEDTVISHICKICGIQVESDTRYTPYDGHHWVTETIDGAEVNSCANCGVVR